MAVVRWSPWNDLFDLHTQMDHAFQSPATASRNGVEYTSLPVDIQQTDGGVHRRSFRARFQPR